MRNVLILLEIINQNGNIKKLIYNGIPYKEIPNIVNSAINEGFLVFSENSIRLTDLGQTYLNNNYNKLKNVNKEEWIEKDFKSKIPKLDKNTIFVPLQNELTF